MAVEREIIDFQKRSDFCEQSWVVQANGPFIRSLRFVNFYGVYTTTQTGRMDNLCLKEPFSEESALVLTEVPSPFRVIPLSKLPRLLYSDGMWTVKFPASNQRRFLE